MKQTAVEYIKKKLQGYGFDFGYVLDEALEMEKEQIIDAYESLEHRHGENYYNETFKKTEQ